MRIVKGILIIVVLVVIVHSLATLILGRMVDSRVRAIKRQGMPVTAADLLGPPTPDSENAAVLYDRASAEQGRLDEQDKAIYADTTKWRGHRRTDPVLWAQVRQSLARRAGVIDQIEAATRLPKCRFSIRTGNAYDLNTAMFRVYARMRRLSQVLVANASFNAEDGNMDACVRSLDLGFRVTHAFDGSETMISDLVKIAVVTMPLMHLNRIIREYEINEAQARRLYDGVSALNLDFDYARVLENERVLALSMFDSIRGKGLPPGEWQPPLSWYPWRVVVTYPGRPFLYGWELSHLRKTSRQIDLVRSAHLQPGGSAAEVAAVDRLVKRPEFTSEPSKMFERYISAQRRTRAMQHLAQASLALITYRHRFGGYPANLEQLRSRLGWAVGGDPFSAGDLKYRREGKGFLVYSIGPDRKDDRGLKPYDRARSETGDMIWTRAF